MSNYQLRTEGMATANSNMALSKALNDWFTEYGPTAIFKSCANCKHMDPNVAPPLCQKFGATPPASIIVAGCPAHEDAEDIPF